MTKIKGRTQGGSIERGIVGESMIKPLDYVVQGDGSTAFMA